MFYCVYSKGSRHEYSGNNLGCGKWYRKNVLIILFRENIAGWIIMTPMTVNMSQLVGQVRYFGVNDSARLRQLPTTHYRFRKLYPMPRALNNSRKHGHRSHNVSDIVRGEEACFSFIGYCVRLNSAPSHFSP